MSLFQRFEKNPILQPLKDHDWESVATFNGCPVADGKNVHFLYRAVSKNNVSSIGYAKSADGIHFTDRRQFILPEHDWERYGCEDPRVTKFEGAYYIFYTALSKYPFEADGIKIALAITKDFKTIEVKHPITPFNAKAMALFPERINDKIAVILTVHTDRPPAHICIALFDTIEDIWSPAYWEKWYASLNEHILDLKRSNSDHLEVGAPPLKTKKGWL
ncbi:MAG: putative glycosidase ph1107 protein, partial [Parcubacteria group bacterium Gr01-1014_70]